MTQGREGSWNFAEAARRDAWQEVGVGTLPFLSSLPFCLPRHQVFLFSPSCWQNLTSGPLLSQLLQMLQPRLPGLV
jgi:hypothetical protein